MFSLGRGGRIFSIHRFICLVKVDIMTLFWKIRDGTGCDFKYLLGCAAFLGQLAKRKLHSLKGMVMSLVPSVLRRWNMLFWKTRRPMADGVTCKW